MTEAAAENDGESRITARLPVGWVLGGIAFALLIVTALIFLLYEETRGPGEILRDFARRVDAADCPGSYELLDDAVRASFSEDQWCNEVRPSLDDGLDADFTLERSVLEGDVAQVQISGVPITEWELTRFGERSWRVVGPPEGFPFAVTRD
ncbi:MAG: hypothetical protein M3135_06290 [Actinomycetota bacterium]|nr:hypothetical protein [Actinomycetota bacterium]